jgi:WD40 repeat protein
MMRLSYSLFTLGLIVTGCGESDLLPIPPFRPEPVSGKSAASIGNDGRLVIQAHDGCIDAICFSPLGDEIATCGLDGAIRVWNANDGACMRGVRSESRVVAIDYWADGSLLIAGTSEGGIHAWKCDSTMPKVVGRSAAPPQTVACSPDCTLLAVGTSPIQLFRSSDWKEIRQTAGHEAYGDTLVFSANGRFLVSDNPDGFAKVWDVPSLRERFAWKHDSWVTGVDISADSNSIVTASCQRNADSQTMQLTILDAGSGQCVRQIEGMTIRGHLHFDIAVKFTPDGRLLISSLRGAHDTGEVRDDEIQIEDAGGVFVWEAQSGKLIGICEDYKDVYRIAISSDGERFALADVHGLVEVWRTKDFLKAYPAH